MHRSSSTQYGPFVIQRLENVNEGRLSFALYIQLNGWMLRIAKVLLLRKNHASLLRNAQSQAYFIGTRGKD